MKNEPDIQARYLVATLDVLVDKLKATSDPSTIAMCRSARAQAQRLVDAFSYSHAEPRESGNVLAFRKRG